MHALANINGQIIPLADATVPVLDRGFLFGDSVYEVLRIYRGKPWLMTQHFDRLQRSLEAIQIQGVDIDRLKQRLTDTIAAGNFSEAIAYLQITRGSAPKRKHAFPEKITPFEFLYVDSFEDSYRHLRQSGARAVTQPDVRWTRCDIKSTNLLGNVLANQAAAQADCVEALLYKPDGMLTEGSCTSCFAVIDGTIMTPPNSSSILPGITRQLVLQLAERANLPVDQHNLRIDDLPNVSELFITGTTTEVLPIIQVDEQQIGDGLPGPVTRRLQQVYAITVDEFI